MKSLAYLLAAFALITLAACDLFTFHSSDNRSSGGDGWTRDSNNNIIPAPTPDPIEEALND